MAHAVAVDPDLRHLLGGHLVIGGRQLETPDGFVEGADRVVVHRVVPEADVIVVRPDRHVLSPQRGIAPRQDRDDVASRRRQLGERQRALHRLTDGANAGAVHRHPQDPSGRGAAEVQVGGHRLAHGRCGALKRDLRGLERPEELRRHEVHAHERDARSGAVAARRGGARHEPWRRLRVGVPGQRDHHELAGPLLGRQHHAVPPRTGEHGLGTV